MTEPEFISPERKAEFLRLFRILRNGQCIVENEDGTLHIQEMDLLPEDLSDPVSRED